ncbi:Reverse transcriptase domain [Arabidopsis thaliana x Arabidopsis arenosa]|uniref:Reverse transcriptase domain n=1 Tax=Arabidopsis thaliana x Arabidopsis arenosa TaxID=1240361 RepID=A0A8T2C5L1_9BRAS|nr:Reverse transcriptase domain [Arabidopsis thaliana x Arabidopsis arenosa]
MGMRDFQEAVRYCSLSDMQYHGPLFTWCNKREDEELICKKLDRVLVNDSWIAEYSQSYGVFEAGGCSDHLRCRIKIGAEKPSIRKPFKFTNALASNKQFLQMIKEYWDNTSSLYHSTSAMYRFSKKLKALKPEIKRMSKEKLGDLIVKTKAAYEKLCKLQLETLTNPTDMAMRNESEAYHKWVHLSGLEEKYLKQKSKLHWLKVGDGNNKAFYKAAKIREVRNAIKEIKCSDGTIVDTQEEIKKEAERFFCDLLTHRPGHYQGMSEEDLNDLVSYRCSEAEKLKLVREVSEEEIKETLFAMPKDKSPGPDGFTVEFLKETWPIVKKDFVVAIQSFFLYGFIPKGVNTTILALIPKKKEVKEMKDYRPISCCNVTYKVISKLIANRLKLLLPAFISPNQSAFVKDRLLMENVLLASEVVKDYHKETVSSRCEMKIDISKAFDSVQWPFLMAILSTLNLPQQFIKWIELCVTSASFSVQVNGELSGLFRSERGLRQGCSLSPYLFVICMHVLSKMIDKAALKGKIGYHPRCQKLQLTHLCFADDLLVFTDGKKSSVEGILTIFDKFAEFSGLKISLEKSTLYMAGVRDVDKEEILHYFPFESGSLPVRYLGLPLLTKRMTLNDYTPLLERIREVLTAG